jgi:hypothetical protein
MENVRERRENIVSNRLSIRLVFNGAKMFAEHRYISLFMEFWVCFGKEGSRKGKGKFELCFRSFLSLSTF